MIYWTFVILIGLFCGLCGLSVVDSVVHRSPWPSNRKEVSSRLLFVKTAVFVVAALIGWYPGHSAGNFFEALYAEKESKVSKNQCSDIHETMKPFDECYLKDGTEVVKYPDGSMRPKTSNANDTDTQPIFLPR